MKKLISFYITLFAFVPFAYSTTYDGAVYEIKQGTPNLLAEGIEATLTNKGSSYTIKVSAINIDMDNVLMDIDGNLSRDGYVPVDGLNYFLLSGYIKDDSLVCRFGGALQILDPEMIFFTYEFRGKVRMIPTISEMEEQGLVQAVSDLDYTGIGTWGDSKSVFIQISDHLWFGSYVCKYNLNADDFLYITTAHPAVVVYKGEIQQPVETLTKDGVNHFLFKTAEAGVYYVQVSATPNYSDADYLFNIHRYGQLQSLAFGNISHITSDLSETEIENALQNLTITGVDIYGQNVNLSNLSGLWNINMEEKKASFIPVFLPFADFEYPLSTNVNNEISWSPTGITETSFSFVIVSTQNLQITISNTAEKISIYNLGGQLVAQGTGAGSYVVPQAGVYVVKIGKMVKKVIIT